MSMSKEDGWEDYHCYDCGNLLGHFYVGFGWRRLYGWILMIHATIWKSCSLCALRLRIRLRGGRMWMISTPMAKNDYFDRLWRESRDDPL